jgi:hypothetical protein
LNISLSFGSAIQIEGRKGTEKTGAAANCLPAIRKMQRFPG